MLKLFCLCMKNCHRLRNFVKILFCNINKMGFRKNCHDSDLSDILEEDTEIDLKNVVLVYKRQQPLGM